MEGPIDEALIASVGQMERFEGRTIVVVDVSGSMFSLLSERSDMRRVDAAATLGSVINGDVRAFAFASSVREVPYRVGMAGVDAYINVSAHLGGGTDMRAAVKVANSQPHDRLIVITDEQSATPVPDPVAKRAYMINVAPYQHGVGYGKWVHIDGFSVRASSGSSASTRARPDD